MTGLRWSVGADPNRHSSINATLCAGRRSRVPNADSGLTERTHGAPRGRRSLLGQPSNNPHHSSDFPGPDQSGWFPSTRSDRASRDTYATPTVGIGQGWASDHLEGQIRDVPRAVGDTDRALSPEFTKISSYQPLISHIFHYSYATIDILFRGSRKRRHHLPTAWGEAPTRSATARLVRPSALARIMRARRTKP